MFQGIFFQAICKMGIFMICAQTIVHFRPKESYEKYCKLLVGMMVLLLLMIPLTGFLLGEDSQLSVSVVEEYQRIFDGTLPGAAENERKAQELLERMTMEEIGRRMEAEEKAAGMSEDAAADGVRKEEAQKEETQKEEAQKEETQKEEPRKGAAQEEDAQKGAAKGQ